MEQRSDRELVVAARQGQRPAYAQLVRRHYQPVFLVCLGVLGNVHDAEDAAQDALIAGFERLGQLRAPEQFRSWLLTIARNLSINLIRRSAVNQRLLDRRPEDSEPKRDAGDELHRAIAELPRDLRLPLVMYYFDGRSVKAVAQALEISTSGVYVKLRTAIRELHEALTAEGDKP